MDDTDAVNAAAKEPMPGVANHPDGVRKETSGPKSNHWNRVIAGQTVQAVWFNPSDKEMRERQLAAAIAGLNGIAPKDELEAMIAAQLIAAHNAAMECYRRAAVEKYGFRENLSLAGKLSRAYAMLLDALNRHRGKGQQKIEVKYVHVHSGGQAVVGIVEAPGGGVQPKSEDQLDGKQIAKLRLLPPLPNPISEFSPRFRPALTRSANGDLLAAHTLLARRRLAAVVRHQIPVTRGSPKA